MKYGLPSGLACVLSNGLKALELQNRDHRDSSQVVIMCPEQLPSSMIASLRSRLTGRVIVPGDSDYEDARSVWNGRIDRRPAVIAGCTSGADIIAAVDCARDYDMLLSVRAGGHHVAGLAACDGGLMIDLSRLQSIRVDPEARTARVEPGLRTRERDLATQRFGLATPGGICSLTGVAGVTLAGGTGWLSRRFGLALDNLLSADVVTAKGELIRASESEHPELFWGIRGGGGNFGIITSFEFQLHEVGPEVLVGQAFHRFEDAPAVFDFYRRYMTEASGELSVYAILLHLPPEPEFPPAFHGETAIALVACYSGDLRQGEALLEPLQSFGDPIAVTVGPMLYTDLQQNFDPMVPAGERWYWRCRPPSRCRGSGLRSFRARSCRSCSACSRSGTSSVTPTRFPSIPKTGSRTGTHTSRQLPDSLVRALRAFQDEMNEVDLDLGRRQLTGEAAQQRVSRACEALLEEVHEVTRVERLVEFGVDDLLSFRDTANLEEGIGVYVFRLTFPYVMSSTTLARVYAKPRGYPDDFETVELILANQPQGDGNLGPLLDHWFLQRPVCRARRELHGELARRIEEIARGADDSPVALTALSCDTARELLDVLARPDPPAIRAVCVEPDAGALVAMKSLAEKAGVRDRISRLKADPVQVIEGTLALPLPPQRMIYSLGLAEYLDDEQFLALLDWGYENLLPGGVMVVSTFGDTNPDRLLMEHILEWRVRHRGDRELEMLARRSRFAGAEISPDATGVLRLLTCTRAA